MISSIRDCFLGLSCPKKCGVIASVLTFIGGGFILLAAAKYLPNAANSISDMGNYGNVLGGAVAGIGLILTIAIFKSAKLTEATSDGNIMINGILYKSSICDPSLHAEMIKAFDDELLADREEAAQEAEAEFQMRFPDKTDNSKTPKVILSL